LEAAMAAGIKAVVVLSGVCMGLGVAIPRSAAQTSLSDVAYVESVSGRVTASAQGSPTLLDVLDIIGDQTRLDLPANSELRLCHYKARKLLTLKGPLRASITASGVTPEGGKAIAASAESCAAPVMSTFQGGVVSRNIGLTMTSVSLRPTIKVINQGTQTINRITLWDGLQQRTVATFERDAARPVLEDGKSYLLVAERSDGRELKLILQASADVRIGPLMVVVP
jgi:hypothetical protein